MRATTVLAAFMTVSPLLRAQTTSLSTDTVRLSLAEARALAINGNPELRAARLDINIARGELRQASVLLRSNPEADVLAGGAGPELGIGQEIEVGLQRGARRAAARAGMDRATASVTDVARTVLNDVDRAFYRFVATDRRSALADEVLGLNRRLAETSRRQLQAGEISRLEFNLAIVEFGRARARSLSARRERTEAVSALRLLVGLAPTLVIAPVIDSTVEPVGQTTPSVEVPLVSDSLAGPDSIRGDARGSTALNTDSLTMLALARRPDLAERVAAFRETRAQVSVARREAFPNLILRASSEPVESDGGKRELRPGVGFTLPAFNRNQGEIEARRAAARQAELAVAGADARVRAEVALAVASYTSAAGEAQILGTTVLVPARENRRLLEIAFREGKVGLPVLLLIRNQVIDAELEYWAAWLAEHEALADLAAATGETIAGFTPGLPK